MRPFTIHVVLVRSIYERNVGACSRAMANMGSANMILIDPKCEIGYEAQLAAATGQEALQNRSVYSSWSEFFKNEPEGLRIAFSTKDGKGRQLKNFADCLRWLKQEHPWLNEQESGSSTLPVYLIFGPEDWGLSNDDIEFSHYNVLIPTYGPNPSLNLAQAVLLGLFILRDNWGGEQTPIQFSNTGFAENSKIDFIDDSLKKWIQEMGFDIDDRRVNAYSILKRMLLHNVPTSKEADILHTVLQQGIRKLQEYNEMRAKLGLPNIYDK